MAVITWDETGKRFYETGVDHGVLYPISETGKYTPGVAWNGLTALTETPEGAEIEDLYADNIKYLSLLSAETFGGTIEAYTYPDEFMECDGSKELSAGVVAYQQTRKTFGLCYRTILGNDVDGNDKGYKLHLIYGCKASVSERAYSTINDSPEAITFSWEFKSTPVTIAQEGFKPTSCIIIDSTKVAKEKMTLLEKKLYGDTSTEPELPLPDEVLSIIGA